MSRDPFSPTGPTKDVEHEHERLRVHHPDACLPQRTIKQKATAQEQWLQSSKTNPPDTLGTLAYCRALPHHKPHDEKS